VLPDVPLIELILKAGTLPNTPDASCFDGASTVVVPVYTVTVATVRKMTAGDTLVAGLTNLSPSGNDDIGVVAFARL
jgi:hypothetical protein